MRVPAAVTMLDRDLSAIVGPRLRSLVIYGLRAHDHHGHDAHDTSHGHAEPPTHTLAVIEMLSADDLRRCAERVDGWHEAGLATPLLVGSGEFSQSLDAFPFEFGAILADHQLVSGSNPFEGLAVDPANLRHACEVQARGHLLHLRHGFVETRGRSDALAVLIVRSAPAFAALLLSVARLDGGASSEAPDAVARAVERRLELPPGSISSVVALAHVKEISSAEAERVFPPYLDGVDRLVRYVDGWSHG